MGYPKRELAGALMLLAAAAVAAAEVEIITEPRQGEEYVNIQASNSNTAVKETKSVVMSVSMSKSSSTSSNPAQRPARQTSHLHEDEAVRHLPHQGQIPYHENNHHNHRSHDHGIKFTSPARIEVNPESVQGTTQRPADPVEKQILESKSKLTVGKKEKKDSKLTKTEATIDVIDSGSIGVQPHEVESGVPTYKHVPASDKEVEHAKYEIVGVNRGKEDEGSFDFVDLSERPALKPSATNQASRISIKKGPNGQDYEYEYVYYYYDDDEEIPDKKDEVKPSVSSTATPLTTTSAAVSQNSFDPKPEPRPAFTGVGRQETSQSRFHETKKFQEHSDKTNQYQNERDQKRAYLDARGQKVVTFQEPRLQVQKVLHFDGSQDQKTLYQDGREHKIVQFQEPVNQKRVYQNAREHTVVQDKYIRFEPPKEQKKVYIDSRDHNITHYGENSPEKKRVHQEPKDLRTVYRYTDFQGPKDGKTVGNSDQFHQRDRVIQHFTHQEPRITTRVQFEEPRVETRMYHEPTRVTRVPEIRIHRVHHEAAGRTGHQEREQPRVPEVREPTRVTFQDTSSHGFQETTRATFQEPSRSTFLDSSRPSFQDSRPAFQESSRSTYQEPTRTSYQDLPGRGFQEAPRYQEHPPRGFSPEPQREVSTRTFSESTRNHSPEPVREIPKGSFRAEQPTRVYQESSRRPHEEEHDHIPSRVRGGSRFSGGSTTQEPLHNEVVPTHSRQRGRGRGQHSEEASTETVTQRFRSRTQETDPATVKPRTPHHSERSGVRRPSLELVDSSSFRTHSADNLPPHQDIPNVYSQSQHRGNQPAIRGRLNDDTRESDLPEYIEPRQPRPAVAQPVHPVHTQSLQPSRPVQEVPERPVAEIPVQEVPETTAGYSVQPAVQPALVPIEEEMPEKAALDLYALLSAASQESQDNEIDPELTTLPPTTTTTTTTTTTPAPTTPAGRGRFRGGSRTRLRPTASSVPRTTAAPSGGDQEQPKPIRGRFTPNRIGSRSRPTTSTTTEGQVEKTTRAPLTRLRTRPRPTARTTEFPQVSPSAGPSSPSPSPSLRPSRVRPLRPGPRLPVRPEPQPVPIEEEVVHEPIEELAPEPVPTDSALTRLRNRPRLSVSPRLRPHQQHGGLVPRRKVVEEPVASPIEQEEPEDEPTTLAPAPSEAPVTENRLTSLIRRRRPGQRIVPSN